MDDVSVFSPCIGRCGCDPGPPGGSHLLLSVDPPHRPYASFHVTRCGEMSRLAGSSSRTALPGSGTVTMYTFQSADLGRSSGARPMGRDSHLLRIDGAVSTVHYPLPGPFHAGGERGGAHCTSVGETIECHLGTRVSRPHGQSWAFDPLRAGRPCTQENASCAHLHGKRSWPAPGHPPTACHNGLQLARRVDDAGEWRGDCLPKGRQTPRTRTDTLPARSYTANDPDPSAFGS